MTKTTDILLGLILIVLSVFLVVIYVGSLSPQIAVSPNVNFPEQKLGFSGYNELGASGMTHATSGISISVATGSTHAVMSENWGRMYARISNDTASDYFTVYFTNSTSTATGTTPTFGVGTLEKGNGILLAPGEEYIIDPDNLWKGEVIALASSSATATISYIEK